MDKDKLIQKYNITIYEIVKNKLDESGKNIDDFDYKTDLHKIFEYFSCIKLTQEYNKPFYEYDDIPIEYKELNCMSKNDTGIDACNLVDMIVQCKLRQQSLTWKECATFFGSNLYADSDGKSKTRWDYLIITRNQESKLADNLNEKLKFNQFIDKTYPRIELLSYCKGLIENPPEYFKDNTTIEKRDYQEECIKLINEMDNENLIICLPTGTGKNFIITHSLQSNVKYLILVPRIMLMEQIRDEIVKYHPRMKSKIQMVGDSNNEFKSEKDITICVFNSVGIVKDHIESFNKIFVDEAHHIRKPEIYKDEDDYSCSSSDLDSEYEDDFDEDVSYTDDEYFEDEEELNEEDIEDDFDDDVEPRTEQKDEVKEEIDDPENENCDNKTFTKIIKEFSKLNNNVYLSATIDAHHGFKFYQKDIREMIEKGYLCDYTINIPIFNEDPTNILVCKYLIKNHHNIIIYCNSHKDGKSINKLMNSIQKGCSEYIDCHTSRKKRNDILNNYKSGKLPFLVNVKILVEGFDAPITNGVCFMSLPSSSTTLIQIIGRALRLDPKRLKTMAKVILPFSKKEDEKAISNFMKVMAKNDSRIRKSYDNKKLGGYFNIENIFDDEEKIEDLDLMVEPNIKYELIFDKMGTLKNSEEIWLKKLEEVKKYIDENKELPSKYHANQNIKIWGNWISTQKANYKNKLKIMSNINIYKKWYEFINDNNYKNYFDNNIMVWLNTFEKIKIYIENNKKCPTRNDPDINVKYFSQWISKQIMYNKKNIYVMKNEEIHTIWNNFINDINYKDYFIDKHTLWEKKLEYLKEYIDINKKLPSKNDTNIDIKKLYVWITVQKRTYKNRKDLMTVSKIFELWKSFINDIKYKEYFFDKQIIWHTTYEKVKIYIDTYNKRPSSSDKNILIKQLATWVNTQLQNFKLKNNNMKDPEIYTEWFKFMNDNKYKDYFLDNNNIWLNSLENVKKYINTHNKRPSCMCKDKEIKSLGEWIIHQISNYKNKTKIMKDSIIYNEWTNFINDDIYKEYFLDNNTIWFNNLVKVKKYIDENNKRPSSVSKNKEIKTLGTWINTQQRNYKNNKEIMKDSTIYDEWTNFINSDKYNEYFLDNNTIWLNNLEKVRKYIDQNNKRPSMNNNDYSIKTLGAWINTQQYNYKSRKYIMSDSSIYDIWTTFINDYKYNLYFINDE